jgi:ER-bound oxygenase mpaB/B'/Rubber oxygenase, catalytic domain
MAWPNPFRRRDSNTRTCWGYTFQLTSDHLSLEQAHPLKFSYDTLGEECLDILNELVSPETTVRFHETGAEAKPSQDVKENPPAIKAKTDLYLLLRDNVNRNEKLKQLWDDVNDVPDWVNWDQVSRGQEVFYRYGGATLTGLAYQSLLGGMGANRVVEVLARTGGFGVKVARHRLLETTQHILECTMSLESIKPGGAGFASSIRVRLLHAAVRQRIMKLAKTRPEYYNAEKYGIPINDLDCIATIGTFSATIIWLSLPRQGIWLCNQEIEDYIALWRLIAHYTGTPTEPFETPEKAKAIMESLLMNEINPTETSKVLAANIICCLEAQPPAFASRSFLEVNARWLNGNELCDALGLGRPSFYYWALMAGQCIFFMSICYTYRCIPYLDRRKIAALRRIFWAIIVEGKHGLGEKTVFDFKYIPDYHINTSKGDGAQVALKYSATGIERQNLKTLIIALAATGVVVWTGVSITSSILKRLFW